MRKFRLERPFNFKRSGVISNLQREGDEVTISTYDSLIRPITLAIKQIQFQVRRRNSTSSAVFDPKTRVIAFASEDTMHEYLERWGLDKIF